VPIRRLPPLARRGGGHLQGAWISIIIIIIIILIIINNNNNINIIIIVIIIIIIIIIIIVIVKHQQSVMYKECRSAVYPPSHAEAEAISRVRG
jgi:uncharacterized membrane protein YhaH (DUF805 family)